jgi:hypothetical protein
VGSRADMATPFVALHDVKAGRRSGDGDRRHAARAVDQLEPHRSLRAPGQLAAAGLHNARSPNTCSSPLERSKGTSRTPARQDQACRGREVFACAIVPLHGLCGTDCRSGAPGGRESRQAPDSGIPQCRSGRIATVLSSSPMLNLYIRNGATATPSHPALAAAPGPAPEWPRGPTDSLLVSRSTSRHGGQTCPWRTFSFASRTGQSSSAGATPA